MGFVTADLIDGLPEPIIYQVEHSRLVAAPDIYDTKLIGFFLKKDDVERVIENYSGLVGFRDYPQEFMISEMQLNTNKPRKRPSLPRQVYYLYYWEENVEDDIDYVQDIGVFSSLKRAKEVKAELMNKYGCDKDVRNCFFIEKYEINTCFWCEGFD